MLTAALLVLMMTIPGVALFYGGWCAKKRAFHGDAKLRNKQRHQRVVNSFGIQPELRQWRLILRRFQPGAFAAHDGRSLSGTFSQTIFMTFQMTFAILTVALIAGAVAERMKFSALMIFLSLFHSSSMRQSLIGCGAAAFWPRRAFLISPVAR